LTYLEVLEMNEIEQSYKKLIFQMSEMLRDIGTDSFSVQMDVQDDWNSSEEDRETVFRLQDQLLLLHKKVESLSWLNDHLRILTDFAQTCSKTLEEDVLIRKAYELVSKVMPTDAFYFALYHEEAQEIHIPFTIDRGVPEPYDILPFGDDNYTSMVIKGRKTIHSKTARETNDLGVENSEDTNTCIFVPLFIDDQVKGVISAQSYDEFAFRKEHEELLQMIGNQVIHSIETARLYDYIYNMSLTDEMTGLRNFRAFQKDFSEVLKKEQSAALYMLDSDNLKKINDRYGHLVGDQYLQCLANGMKSLCSDNIEAYRYAGDEFMIIMKSPDRNEISKLVERLLDYLAVNQIQVEDRSITVSFSAGVSIYPDHGDSIEILKKTADQALYRAKDKGKNNYCVY
jgi:diguanylate cyclase (GGDEF)-like protein